MQKENSKKSRNGRDFETKFSNETNLPKLRDKDKPRFINEWGKEQIIDSDFLFEDNGRNIFLDLTTTFRTDRAKQKAYNALCSNISLPTKRNEFYVVIPDEEYKEVYQKRTKAFSLQGLNGVISYSEAVNIVRGKK